MKENGKRLGLPKTWRQKVLLMIKILVIVKLREYIVSQLCKIAKIYELATIV